jgi:hypothetical protein
MEPTDCEQAAQRYLERFGWPCVADGFAVWTLAGQAFDAVDVPASHGPAVLSALRSQTGHPPQVITIPGDPAFWRFLVQPRAHVPRAWRATLTTAGAHHLTTAARIELPPTRVPGGELTWVRPPLGRLTTLDQLVAALR